MRMPFSHFLTNGDLKFVIVLLALLLVSFLYFIKKFKQKTDQEYYNTKLRKLANWSILIGLFSLLLGLLHSFYFMSHSNGIANNLLFGGLSNMLITPTLATAISIVIRLLSTPFPVKPNS